MGANDRINVGVVGCGNRGSYLLDVFRKSPKVKVVAVGDVFGENCDRAARAAGGVRKFGDHRRIVEPDH